MRTSKLIFCGRSSVVWWKLNFTIRLFDLVTGDFLSEESSMSVFYSAAVQVYDPGQVVGCGK